MATAANDEKENAPREEQPSACAWSVDFTSKTKRKASKKEKLAIEKSKLRLAGNADPNPDAPQALETVKVDDVLKADPALAIPRNLTLTKAQRQEQQYFDNDRWYCVSRPQYPTSCGVSSLTSVWNFLYSNLGSGTLPPVSQEEVLSILGFNPPFDQIRFGPFTGNVTLMRWFHAINKHFGVTGKAYFQWKVHGQGRTMGINADQAKATLKGSLRSPQQAVIYHCHNHYFVPIGYQDMPVSPINAYASDLKDHEVDTHIIIGEVSRKFTSLHVKSWRDITTDLSCQSPQYFNIRYTDRGVMTKERTKRPGGNLHCLIVFRSDEEELDMTQFEREEEEEEEVEEEGPNSAAVPTPPATPPLPTTTDGQ